MRLAAGGEPWVRWDWVGRHLDTIGGAVVQHLQLTVIALVVGLAISVPLGLVAWRYRGSRDLLLGITGGLYTIPSLALFAILVPWTGLSTTTAEVGLVSYTLLILVRNIVVGLDAVPEDAREAATAMGFRAWRRLLEVDLPLAMPVILAGLRVATVTTIGLVTVTAVLGQGGLGQLILEGLIRDFPTPLVVGAILSVGLAVAADLLLALAQRALTPWTRGVA